MLEKIASGWNDVMQWLNHLSLVKQFALAGSIVVLIAMTVIGRWVAAQIETGVINSTSAATALYMDAVLAPVVARLTTGKAVDPIAQQRIDRILARTELGQKVISIKIWKKGGIVAYASQKELIGRQFVPSKHLKQAWGGTVSAEFDSLYDDEDAYERGLGLTLLEMYMPVRDNIHGNIIAVAEFYVLGEQLNADLAMAYRRSWLLVGLVTLAMMAALFGIVRRGNRTIDAQRNALESRLYQNEQLRNQVQRAYKRAEHLKEQFLRKVGADLHDGPAQLIGLALLRLDSLRPPNGVPTVSCGTQEATFDVVRDTLKDALKEIRKQSAGLALPELEEADLKESIELAINGHEKRTDTRVIRDINISTIKLADDVKICLYRFVQEGLNNSFRHANAEQQEVRARISGTGLLLEVKDRGPGMTKRCGAADGHGIGLIALRDRVESLGGRFTFETRDGGGCSLTAHFDRNELETSDA